MVEENASGNLTPQYYYTPANTDVDLFGIDPYPVQTNVPNNYDLNIIPLAVQSAESIGIPQQDLVPTYQAFGDGSYSTYILPTAAQEQAILSEWGSVLPNPAFDYTYSWGAQEGDTALGKDPALQQVFADNNAGSGCGPEGLHPPRRRSARALVHRSANNAVNTRWSRPCRSLGRRHAENDLNGSTTTI